MTQTSLDYYALNAMLNLYGEDGSIQFDKDKEAARQYHLQHVNDNTVYFHDLKEKLDYLVDEGYYDEELLNKYDFADIKRVYQHAYSYKFRFPTFLGAYKFYTSYALKKNTNDKYLERFEDRIAITALYLADGNTDEAFGYVDEIITGRLQPATPTFLNAGRKQGGEPVSCFPAGAKVLMENGVHKNIEDIKVGDMVVTHKGNLKKVYKTIENDANNKKMIVVKPANSPAITMTENHPVLVYSEDERDLPCLSRENTESKEYRWVEAKDIRPHKDFVVLPYQKEYGNSEYTYDLLEITNKYREDGRLSRMSQSELYYEEETGLIRYLLKGKKHSKKQGTKFSTQLNSFKRFVKADGELGRFIGYYLAEGYCGKRYNDGRITSIVFTFGSKEEEFINDVIHLSENIFGITPRVYNGKDNSTSIQIHSVPVSTFIYDLVGTGFNKKILTHEMCNASDEFTYNLLIGAFRGDGCLYENKLIMDLVNPNLVRQLRALALRLGLVPSMRDYINNKNHLSTSLSFMGNFPSNEQFIYDTNKNMHRYVEPKVQLKDYMIRKDNHVLAVVMGKSYTEDVDTVYNLEVEDDHSYVVDGIAVHNCYLLDVQDNMESIGRVINSSLQLSKRGGGVGINLSNLRSSSDPIKGVENRSSGLIPVMKILEDSFSYANQLGARQGAGAVYVSVHHPDILKVLDSKRENADEKIRIKTLSIGLIVSDKMFELAQKNKDIYQFSPYDVERIYGKCFSELNISDIYDDLVSNPNVKKTKTNARDLFMTIAEIQFQSGYPYLMFEDQVNRMNNTPNVGRIQFSNLCSEILQPTVKSELNPDLSYKTVGMDISCNLASMNIAKQMLQADHIGVSVERAIRSLTKVSELSNIESVPSVENGNNKSHAVGLGQMNLHGFLGSQRIHYGSFEALDFVNMYFSTVLYHAVKASNTIAREKGETFDGFEGSKFQTGEFFEPFIHARFDVHDEDQGGHDLFVKTDRIKELFSETGFEAPTRADWEELAQSVRQYGIYNRQLLASAPTGNISYVSDSTASIHPVSRSIEVRKEGKIGRVYRPSYGLTQDNMEYYTSAYDLGAKPLIETYNTAAPYVDQGQSMTLFFRDTATTRDLNKAYSMAWAGTTTFHGNDYEGAGTPWDRERRQRLGAVSKTIYYVRIYQEALVGTEVEGCVSCML